MPRARCERCGAPARVYILEEYVDGKPVHRHLCLGCANTAYERYLRRGAGHVRPRPSLSALLIAAGLVLVILGASADLFGIQGSAGFGWKQQASLLAGALAVILGALLRVDALMLGGSVLVAVAVLADVYGTIGSPGIGWRQRAAIVAGLVLVQAALFLRKRHGLPRLPDAD